MRRYDSQISGEVNVSANSPKIHEKQKLICEEYFQNVK